MRSKVKKLSPTPMLPAALLLENYFVEEFSFSSGPASASLVELPDPAPGDVEVGIEVWNHPDNARRVACRILIGLEESARERVPYRFNITVFGFFEVAEDFPSERANDMVRFNAPALLYSAAREFVAMTTGRGVAGPLMLPTISFVEQKRIAIKEQAEVAGKRPTARRAASSKAKKRKG